MKPYQVKFKLEHLQSSRIILEIVAGEYKSQGLVTELDGSMFKVESYHSGLNDVVCSWFSFDEFEDTALVFDGYPARVFQVVFTGELNQSQTLVVED